MMKTLLFFLSLFLAAPPAFCQLTGLDPVSQAILRDGQARHGGRFDVVLGVGAGLIHNFGASAVVLRQDANGRYRWLAKVEVESLRPRLGYVPDRVSVGAGVYPFGRPWLSTLLKVGKTSYSDRLGVGPEIVFRQRLTRNGRIALEEKADIPVYFGEPNAKGRPYSVLPELKIGLSVRLFRSNSR